jgi:hypothetical protein
MRILFAFLLVISFNSILPWGFHAHKEINYHACFTLPPEMFGFYKTNIDLIKELPVRPDQRRYVMDDESPRHYIDIDFYESIIPIDTIPFYWDSAKTKYSEEVLLDHGIVPWHILNVKYWLMLAMKNHDFEQILKLSADLGHYIADAHVPLHTTENYNGQLTNQHGIHGLWESRLPEIFLTDYDFFVGNAKYGDQPLLFVWKAIEESFSAKDSVLRIESELTSKSSNLKYSFEQRGATTVRVYSREFSNTYHHMLNNMVERRMKKAIFMIGCFWYSAWVDAGQPHLPKKVIQNFSRELPKDSVSYRKLGKKRDRVMLH